MCKAHGGVHKYAVRLHETGLALALLLAALGFAADHLHAQTGLTGDIIGTVADPSRAVVPGAVVTLKNVNTGSIQITQTSVEGLYRFPLLPPNDYTVTVEAAGFETVTQKVTVHIGQVATVNVQLVLAGSAEKVIVIEQAPLLQTESGNTATSISEIPIHETPNGGNNLYTIMTLAPGAVMPAGGSFPSVNGLPTSSNMVTLNGMMDLDPWNNGTNGGASNLLLGLNEVQEATVTASGFTGEYGSLAGSNTNIVTKGGSNSFHGSGIWYWSGRALNANNFFNNASGTPRPFENANQWAGDFGGPILKNKLFFYGNAEGIRIILPPSSTPSYLPTTQFEQATIANLTQMGLSSSIPFYNRMFDLWNKAPGGSRATDTVPAGSGTVNGVKVATGNGCGSFTGNPQFYGSNAAPCAVTFRSTVPNFNPEHVESFRLDYNISDKDRIFYHFFTDHGVQATSTDPINTIFNRISSQPSWNSELVETHVFNPHAVNQLTLGGEWYSAIFAAADLPAALSTFPVSMTFSDSSFTDLGSGLSGSPSGRAVTSYMVADDFSWERGRHSFKFGGTFTRWDATNFFGTTRQMTVTTLDSFYNGGFNPASSKSNFSSYTQSFPLANEQPFAMYRAGLYAQDQWKVRNNLSLTFALRVDHPSNPVCQHDCFARLSRPFFSANITAGTPYNQAIQVNQHQALQGLQNVEWQPRIGFAWQPRGSSNPTVLRGGIGIFNDNFPMSLVGGFASNPPNQPSFSIASPTLGYISPDQTTGSGTSQITPLTAAAIAANQAFQSGFQSGATLTQLQASNPAFKIPNLTAADGKILLPQYQKWSLELQQGLWRNAAMTIGYQGNHGIHTLLSVAGVNAYSSSFAGLPAAPINPLFLTVTLYESAGTSSYHGMTFSLQQRFSRGLVQFNYTWSHAIAMGFGSGQTRTIEDPFDLRRSIASGDADVRHYANMHYVWTLPIKGLLRGHGWDRLVEGWQLSGTLFLRSGFPFSVTDGTDNSVLAAKGYGGATLLANFTGTSVPDTCTHPNLANKANPCLGAPGTLFTRAQTSFGNAPRNVERGPGYFDTDMSLSKNIRIVAERVSLTIGFQAYNVLNHTNFRAPGSNVTSTSTFGIITTALGPGASVYGSGLGGDSSPRVGQLKLQLRF